MQKRIFGVETEYGIIFTPDGRKTLPVEKAIRFLFEKLITTDDRVIPTARQRQLAESIPGARCFEVEGDHDVCVSAVDRFVPTLIAAARAVTPPTCAGASPVPRSGPGR